MTAEEIKQVREKLEKKIDRTKRKIGRMEDMTRPIAPENAIGRLSRMDAINNKSVMEAALRTARRDLDAMQTALKKIRNGEPFGSCAKCNQSIPLARLLLMPGSPYCVRCAPS